LPTIPDDQRRTETEIWTQFELIRPKLLGVFLDAISLGLRNENAVELDKVPRMADFVKWVIACLPALGIEPKEFLDAYEWNIQNINQLALESSPVSREIMIFVGLRPDNEEEWVGTATELLDELNLEAREAVQRQRAWPKNAKALSNTLTRLTPNLRKMGLEIVRSRGAERLIYLRKDVHNFVMPLRIKDWVKVTPNENGGLRIQLGRKRVE